MDDFYHDFNVTAVINLIASTIILIGALVICTKVVLKVLCWMWRFILGSYRCVFQHKCVDLTDVNSSFDSGSFFCPSCIKLFIRLNDLKVGEIIGLLLACIGAILYIYALVQAVAWSSLEPGCIQTSIFMGLLALVVAYDYRGRPDPVVKGLPFYFGIANLCLMYVFFVFGFYKVTLTMGLIGVSAALFGAFMYQMRNQSETAFKNE